MFGKLWAFHGSITNAQIHPCSTLTYYIYTIMLGSWHPIKIIQHSMTLAVSSLHAWSAAMAFTLPRCDSHRKCSPLVGWNQSIVTTWAHKKTLCAVRLSVSVHSTHVGAQRVQLSTVDQPELTLFTALNSPCHTWLLELDGIKRHV